jgi:hypothetical protein
MPLDLALIKAHIQESRPEAIMTEHSLGYGPIAKTLPPFRVLEMAPTRGFDLWTYCTLGASEVDSGHERYEFLLCSKDSNPAHIELLAMVANFHADPSLRLRPGQILAIGDPWTEGSNCDHLLASVPYPFGSEVEWLNLGAICVHFLWLLPVTASEAQFARRCGVEELEQRFETVSVEYWNPLRVSVV